MIITNIPLQLCNFPLCLAPNKLIIVAIITAVVIVIIDFDKRADLRGARLGLGDEEETGAQ